MKKVDEVKYLAKWVSWSESEEVKVEEIKEQGEDKYIEVVTTPESGTTPIIFSRAQRESLKRSIKDFGTNISLRLSPFTDELTLKQLCSEENQKRIKNGYKLIKAITAPIINKKVSVVEYWMDDETKFFINVTMPLFVIIRDSQNSSKLIDYVKSIKDRRQVKFSDYTSEEVYDLFQTKIKTDKPNLVIEEFIPTMAEYEELRRAIDKKDLNRFVEKLPIYDKDRDIYSFCYHYEELQREFQSFNMEQKYSIWIAIRTESCKLDQHDKLKSAESTEIVKYESWLPNSLKPEIMENMRADTLRMLLYAQRIPLTEEQRKELDELMKIPVVAELYNESMGVKCDTMPEDILFRADMSESKRAALVDLIVIYLSEPTQTRKAKNDKGFTVQTTAQKSVIALLNKSECLHPTIDIFNATELHHITSLFIEQKIGVGNVSYSSKYNEAEIFQNYNPNKLDPETTEYRRYQRFKLFEEDFKKIIVKL